MRRMGRGTRLLDPGLLFIPRSFFFILTFASITAALWAPPWRPQRGSRAQSLSVVPRVPGTQGVRRSQHTTEGGWRMEGPSSRASTGRYYAEPVVNGIPYSVKGYRGSARLYSVQVAGDGEGYLNIMANGGVGDIDIYVRFDEYPTKRIYDMRSATPGNQEQIIIERPQQGRYYIVLYGYEDYRDVGFEAESR